MGICYYCKYHEDDPICFDCMEYTQNEGEQETKFELDMNRLSELALEFLESIKKDKR